MRRVREAAREETAYYPLNAILTPPAEPLTTLQIRNKLGRGPKNLIVLRHMALNLLRKEPAEGALPENFRRAALGETFLLKALAPV